MVLRTVVVKCDRGYDEAGRMASYTDTDVPPVLSEAVWYLEHVDKLATTGTGNCLAALVVNHEVCKHGTNLVTVSLWVRKSRLNGAPSLADTYHHCETL